MAYYPCRIGSGGENIPFVAPDYDSTTTYNTGNVVLYNDVTYKCNTDGTTGTWTASKWDRVYLADLSGNKSSGGSSGSSSSYLENLTTEYVSGTATGSIWVNCSSDAGLWKGSAADTFVAWTNNKGKDVKFVPISGIVETECVLKDGESLHSYVTVSVTKTDSEFASWRQTGTFGNYVSASKDYSFYIIY